MCNKRSAQSQISEMSRTHLNLQNKKRPKRYTSDWQQVLKHALIFDIRGPIEQNEFKSHSNKAEHEHEVFQSKNHNEKSSRSTIKRENNE